MTGGSAYPRTLGRARRPQRPLRTVPRPAAPLRACPNPPEGGPTWPPGMQAVIRTATKATRESLDRTSPENAPRFRRPNLEGSFRSGQALRLPPTPQVRCSRRPARSASSWLRQPPAGRTCHRPGRLQEHSPAAASWTLPINVHSPRPGNHWATTRPAIDKVCAHVKETARSKTSKSVRRTIASGLKDEQHPGLRLRLRAPGMGRRYLPPTPRTIDIDVNRRSNPSFSAPSFGRNRQHARGGQRQGKSAETLPPRLEEKASKGIAI